MLNFNSFVVVVVFLFHNDILKSSRRSRNKTKKVDHDELEQCDACGEEHSRVCSSRAFYGSRASLHLTPLVHSSIASAFLPRRNIW